MTAVADILVNKSVEKIWLDGSKEQQDAALLIERFIFDSEISEAPEETVAQVLYALNHDIQIRDYVLGLIAPDKHVEGVLSWLVQTAPEGYIAAPASILSMMEYENGNKDLALRSIAIAQEDQEHYSLAGLLNRVYSSDWPQESLSKMREVLHPKVKAGIFGEDN